MNDFLPGDAARTLKNFAKSTADAITSIGKSPDYAPLMTAEHVDLSRYAGKWFELARLPLTFQDDTEVNTAEYALTDDGTVSVLNTAYKHGEVEHTIEGTATPAAGAEQTNARLNVRFGGLLKWLPEDEQGNYWVIKIDDDYTLALVGTPDRDSLWLLARDSKQAESDLAKDYIDYAAKAGFDTSKLIIDDWEKGVAHSVADDESAAKGGDSAAKGGDSAAKSGDSSSDSSSTSS